MFFIPNNFSLAVNVSLSSPSLCSDDPTVSLLQKTPSSPVRCHGTGFYPNTALMFWRKDGEEIHVKHGDILPNQDETFQVHVDLDISSLTPNDWPSYDCVFQFSGAKDEIVIKLDKDVILTNFGKNTF